MTLFRLEIPAGDYEGRILADCNTVRLNVPNVGIIEVPVDSLTPVKPSLPEEPPEGFYAAGSMVWQRDDEPRTEYRWWQMGVSTPCTWAKAYEIIKAAGDLMVRLVPDPVVDAPALPLIIEDFDGDSIEIQESAAFPAVAAYITGSKDGVRLTVEQTEQAGRALLAAAARAVREAQEGTSRG